MRFFNLKSWHPPWNLANSQGRSRLSLDRCVHLLVESLEDRFVLSVVAVTGPDVPAIIPTRQLQPQIARCQHEPCRPAYRYRHRPARTARSPRACLAICRDRDDRAHGPRTRARLGISPMHRSVRNVRHSRAAVVMMRSRTAISRSRCFSPPVIDARPQKSAQCAPASSVAALTMRFCDRLNSPANLRWITLSWRRGLLCRQSRLASDCAFVQGC